MEDIATITLDHAIFVHKKQLAKLTKPLLNHTPFEYFDYERFYFDGTTFALIERPEICYHIVKQELLPSLQELHYLNSHYVE